MTCACVSVLVPLTTTDVIQLFAEELQQQDSLFFSSMVTSRRQKQVSDVNIISSSNLNVAAVVAAAALSQVKVKHRRKTHSDLPNTKMVVKCA